MADQTTFRETLLRMMQERGLRPAVLSKRAGLNARAVTDIVEGRAVSPKLSTVFALAGALGVDPAELAGFGGRQNLNKELADYLARFDPQAQEQLLAALRALPLRPSE